MALSPTAQRRIERRLISAERCARELQREVGRPDCDHRIPRWIEEWKRRAKDYRRQLGASP